MINEIVSIALEVIFGLFIISFAANALLGIDIMEALSKLYIRVVYGKKKSCHSEDEAKDDD